jgi:hypothetical protein
MSGSVTARERPQPQLAGGLWLALASAALFGAGLASPGLRPLAVAAPFPVSLLRLRTNRAVAVSAVLLAAALVGASFGPGQALVFTLFLAAPGLLIGEALVRGRGLVRGCGWAFGLWILLAGGLLVADHQALAREALAAFDLISLRFLADVKEMGSPPERAEAMVERVALLRRAVAVVYPALFVITGGLLVALNGALLKAYLARRDPGWLDGGEFEGLRWPFGLAVLFVLAASSVLLPPLRPVAYNVLLVLAFCFALAGLAVVIYYVRRLAAPVLFRGAVLALVLMNPWAFQILALVGLFDLWFDFRKWAQPPPAEG